MSSDCMTLVDRPPKTILIIFRESRSWLTRWYTWVKRDRPQRQIVKDVVIEQQNTDKRRKSSLAPMSHVQEAFEYIVKIHERGDIICIFGFGEEGISATFQLTHMLHTNLAADLCQDYESMSTGVSMEECSVVQCVAVNYNRQMETPLGLLNRTIARLPDSVERVICTNDEDDNIFAGWARRGKDGRMHPKEIWQFDCAPAWRITRHWLMKQTTDLVHYLPEHVKVWFDTQPKLMRRLKKSDDNRGDRDPGSKGEILTFETHRVHDDRIINIIEEDEFDLRYQVWTTQ